MFQSDGEQETTQGRTRSTDAHGKSPFLLEIVANGRKGGSEDEAGA